ncbi:DNA mismatch repair endonuclease MutL [Anaeroselena agilis]|uniref:DNA mismatch repair protein MutL n=1 Tax=Anaeroselena agilis TaxID=3063788 RepID=A0ABU3NX55_9FIRM|nr:DNA mismatch repair endonuclease MutL [Selenomonadales bacterium 4137-cl]
MTQPVIRILDENTANKIAAGEVVERPASVVKELVENALDAYSRNIEVTIADGGVSFIRVADDGVGMSRADAELAILRHATSKIGAAEDLYSVHSLGFRGEALPSIAAVSRFSLTTRPHDADFATYVEVTGGVVSDVREAGGGAGTVVTVADLFFNTPARRKFLKSPATESGHIHDVLGKLALSHPEVSFRLVNNDRLVLATPGQGDVLAAIASLYGPKAGAELLPVSHEEEGLAVRGYVAKPTLLKSSRQWQTFIVNARVVSSRLIAKALDNAYHSLLPKSGYPLAVLNIILPADTVDVNVHPQKSEIKFSDESKLFRAVYRAVSAALTAARPEEAAGAPAFSWPRAEHRHTPAGQQGYAGNSYSPRPDGPAAQQPMWRETPLPFAAAREAIRQEEALAGADAAPLEEEVAPAAAGMSLVPLGQVDECYIVARGEGGGLYIIDQHAAHERILYERLSAASGRIPVQTLLVPVFVDLDPREALLVGENQSVFHDLGFTLEQVGPSAFRITEMPTDVPPGEARDFLHDILVLLEGRASPNAAELRHACLQTAACRAAVKAGDSLSMRQIVALLQELAATSLPYTCPHGRPAIVRFGPDDLAKLFKRT